MEKKKVFLSVTPGYRTALLDGCLVPDSPFHMATELFYEVCAGDYIECLNKECTPVIYECNSLKCKNDKRNNIYTGYVNRVSDNNYTMPYKLIAGVFLGEEFDSGINVSLLKMVF